jgi:hypothetical protein
MKKKGFLVFRLDGIELSVTRSGVAVFFIEIMNIDCCLILCCGF